MTTVRTGSRLHFGLFDLRQFGGVGMMIEEPAVEVTARIAGKWSVNGLLSHRTQFVIDRLTQHVTDLPPMNVMLLRAPPEHAGFGTGTQVSLALATAIIAEAEHEIDHATLARILDRGQRSAIGIHGFRHGGLLIDAGKDDDQWHSTSASRVELPAAWHVLLITPNVACDWSGERERDAFDRLSSQPSLSDREKLKRLAQTTLMPAARTGNLAAYGSALTEFNQLAGELFAPVQGGRYASPVVATIVERLAACGLTGVGQSSWGPTVFAFGVDSHEMERIGRSFAEPSTTMSVTRPRNEGAVVSRKSEGANS